MVNVMKLDKAPKESYADIGGLEQQIQEIKVRTQRSDHDSSAAANFFHSFNVAEHALF